MIEETIKCNCDITDINKAVKNITGYYPNQLPSGSVINLCIADICRENVSKLVKAHLDLSYIAYKNNVSFNILTRKGFVSFDDKYLRQLFMILNTRILDVVIPCNDEGINEPVFTGQLRTLKHLLRVNMTNEHYTWKKPASSYNGDFLGKSSKEDGGEYTLETEPWCIKTPIVVNFRLLRFVNKNQYKDMFYNINRTKLFFSMNNKVIKLPYVKESIDDKSDIIEDIRYVFGYDETILYNENGKYTNEKISIILKDVINNYHLFWFVGKYNLDQFDACIKRLLKNILNSSYDDVVSDLEVDLNDRGFFIEEVVLYEDSYNDDYDNIEDEYLRYEDEEVIIDYEDELAEDEEDEGEDEEDE